MSMDDDDLSQLSAQAAVEDARAQRGAATGHTRVRNPAGKSAASASRWLAGDHSAGGGGKLALTPPRRAQDALLVGEIMHPPQQSSPATRALLSICSRLTRLITRRASLTCGLPFSHTSM